jgi:Tol biopolymer transport system component/DNA-binding winged helix-turn-helix (wHTH) protein
MSRERSVASKAPGPPPHRGDFAIAQRLVRPALNRIEVNGSPVSVEPKIMHVLVRLAASPGEVVTKEQLFRDVWPDTYVTEDVLTRAVGELRKIFDDDPAHPRIIETIRKTGYRLLVPPADPTSAGVASADTASVAPTAKRNRLLAPVALGLIALLAVAAVLLLKSPGPTRSPGPVRIVPVTTFPGNERHPALSPDGTRIAFAWERPGEKTNLYLKLLDAPNPVQLTTSPGSDDEPTWSPDGQRIAFVRRAGENCDLFSVPSIGGAPQRLAACGSRDAGKISWSPQGKEIALSAPVSGGPLRIEILNLQTGERRPLTSPPREWLGDEEPSFSPDGATVSFLRSFSDGVSDIYTVSSAGGEPRRVTFENRTITGADWAPDGRSLIFSSNRAGLFSLWKIPPGGGEPQLIAGGGSKMKHPSTARKGSAVAYENWHYEVNLWRTPIDNPSVLPAGQLTFAADEWEFDPEFSPDGSRIAYVSTKSGADEIWTTSSDGGNPLQLTSFGGPRLGMPRWSPDGRRLVFTARPEGQADLYTIDASGGAPVRLTSTPGDEAAPSWSRDGRFIYFAARRTGDWEVWRAPSAGGTATALTHGGGHTAYESQDGRWVYYSRADAPGIWRMPAAGGQPEEVLAALAPNCWADWRVTGKGIYFKVETNDDHPLIQFLPFGSTQARTVARLDNPAWAGFTVSPDDSAIVYGRADRRDCDIRMIVNAF